MTDPVNRISGAKETSPGGTYGGGRFTEDHKKRKSPAPEDDLVGYHRQPGIVPAAKNRKSILEYLKELLG